jgi:hypothetical protein
METFYVIVLVLALLGIAGGALLVVGKLLAGPR